MSNIQLKSDRWNEDVMFNVFEYLGGKDLLNCEVVCRKWRSLILSATLWKKSLHRKVLPIKVYDLFSMIRCLRLSHLRCGGRFG